MAGLCVGRGLTTSTAVPMSASDGLGFIAVVSFFLMLRVFDEHKDYELDCLNHPNRVLQSGLISLGHLKVLGGIAILIQLGVSMWLDGGIGPVSTVWFVVVGWSLLMAVEFFCGEWLEKDSFYMLFLIYGGYAHGASLDGSDGGRTSDFTLGYRLAGGSVILFWRVLRSNTKDEGTRGRTRHHRFIHEIPGP